MCFHPTKIENNINVIVDEIAPLSEFSNNSENKPDKSNAEIRRKENLRKRLLKKMRNEQNKTELRKRNV